MSLFWSTWSMLLTWQYRWVCELVNWAIERDGQAYKSHPSQGDTVIWSGSKALRTNTLASLDADPRSLSLAFSLSLSFWLFLSLFLTLSDSFFHSILPSLLLSLSISLCVLSLSLSRSPLSLSLSLYTVSSIDHYRLLPSLWFMPLRSLIDFLVKSIGKIVPPWYILLSRS